MKNSKDTSTPAMPEKRRPTMTTFEELKGYITPGNLEFQQAFLTGRREHNYVLLHLKLTADDLEKFVTSPEHQTRLEGFIRCEQLWGEAIVKEGEFHLFIDTKNPWVKRMTYRLFFDDAEGPLTLFGFKELTDDPLTNVFKDCQLLYTKIFRGRVLPQDDDTATLYATGILNLYYKDFIKYDVFKLSFKGPGRFKWGWKFIRWFLHTFSVFKKVKKRGRREK
jgi:cholesterol oxidase